MTEIVDGKVVYNETTKNANGGTELMARRMVQFIPKELLEGVQIIHSRVRELEPNKKRILVCHDMANDPEIEMLGDPAYRKNFDKIVFVSNWQQHTYNMVLGIPFAESEVIRNGIVIDDQLPESIPIEGPIKLIYHTTPHRGLELLIPAFEELSKYFDVHLDVYSSFNAYGWGDRDAPYEQLFERIKALPNATYNGFQPNDVVRKALREAHVFAYPNIWPETSCLAMIEALCAGLFVVNSNLGALPETSLGLTAQYMYDESHQRHVNTFFNRLYGVVKWVNENRENGYASERRHYIARVASNQYNFEMIKNDWINLLRHVKEG